MFITQLQFLALNSIDEIVNENYCHENYNSTILVARSNINFFRESKISWDSMKDQNRLFGRQYLVIDNYRELITYLPENRSYSWYSRRCDLKMILDINLTERLPNILLPLTKADSSTSFKDFTKKNTHSPLLAYCSDLSGIDILIPKGNWGSCRHRIKKETTPNKKAWLLKHNRAWFRGTFNYGALKGRFTILNESLAFPNIIDAKITHWDKWHRGIGKHLKGDFMSLAEAVNSYRYVIVIDGNCDAWRLQDLLGQNVVVLKPMSQEKQWFSAMLIPWVHFIPIELTPYKITIQELKDAYYHNRTIHQKSNIIELMHWVVSNPQKCFEIIQNANLFYHQYLSDKAITCYIRSLFKQLSELFTFNISEKTNELLELYQHNN